MKTTLNLPKELITSIDVMNTLNGGTSQPLVQLKQYDTHRQITIRIPGISLDKVRMEVNNNQLVIYYYTVLKSEDLEVPVPKVLYSKGLPYFVDVDKITASREEHSLVVRLPFNERADGYHRDISITN
jgi:HSP20 family molecular chaperone IbpA